MKDLLWENIASNRFCGQVSCQEQRHFLNCFRLFEYLKCFYELINWLTGGKYLQNH